MKSTFIIILLIAFMGIVVFGLITMNHRNSYDHKSCIVATAQGTDCPKGTDSLSFVSFHLDAFKNFSTAVFGNNILSIFLAIVALISLVGFGVSLRVNVQPPQLGLFSRRRRFLESFYSPFQKELTSWLALHENSPVFFKTPM